MKVVKVTRTPGESDVEFRSLIAVALQEELERLPAGKILVLVCEDRDRRIVITGIEESVRAPSPLQGKRLDPETGKELEDEGSRG